MPEAEITRRVDEALTLVDAQHFRHQPIQVMFESWAKRIYRRALVLQARYLLLDEHCWSHVRRAHSDAAIISRRIVARGNHVIISSHDIDLFMKLAMPYTYYYAGADPDAWRAARFSRVCTEAMEQAGLTQPGWSKLILNWDCRCGETGNGVFSSECKVRIQGGVMTRERRLCCRGRHPTSAKVCTVAGLCRIFYQDGLRTAPF